MLLMMTPDADDVRRRNVDCLVYAGRYFFIYWSVMLLLMLPLRQSNRSNKLFEILIKIKLSFDFFLRDLFIIIIIFSLMLYLLLKSIVFFFLRLRKALF